MLVWITVLFTPKRLASEPVFTGQRQTPQVVACAGCGGVIPATSPAAASAAAATATAVFVMILFFMLIPFLPF